MRLNPFRALRPPPEFAAQVACVPYDVVNREEAASLAAGNPRSFLHVGRPDIDLPASTDPYDDRVYAQGRVALEGFLRDGTLLRDADRTVYVYRQEMDGRGQTGVVACVHVDDYEHDIIRKHEKTRKDKEDDRTRHVLTLDANAEPVFLAYRTSAAITADVAAAVKAPPLYDFVAPDGVRHIAWKVADPSALLRDFAAVPLAYVADGHHRSASAWRAGQERRAANPQHTGNEEYNWFLAVLFPAGELAILPYNRVVKSLSGLTAEAFRARLATLGRLEAVTDPRPPRPGSFAFFLEGRWWVLTMDASTIDRRDPIGSLDVSLLQDRVLGPILGITDPRTDKRIDFVGGIRGTAELERRVTSGEMALGISMYPTTMEQLLAVSDAGKIMPPKSTWFEPKLRSGLFVHELSTA
ncbi:MAG: hypothetical protein H6Q77_1813 [Gemmatimonadetes bacterium]|nr:hypothetical protein [Gemmatimonadota bacterium]